MMMDYYKELHTAVQAALTAGDYFAQSVHRNKHVKEKSSPADLVTEYDPACEKLIVQAITDVFPDHEILGEESTAPGSEASQRAAESVYRSPKLWIVDPIDGTTNFVYQLPLSVVSIAYAEDGFVKVGVVYDPYRQEFFVAAEGLGSWRLDSNEAREWLQRGHGIAQGTAAHREESQEIPFPGSRLHVSDKVDVRGAVLATGFPPRITAWKAAVQATLALTDDLKNLRALGTAALHLAYVAAGRLDGFWEYDLNAWDLAAGCFLIQQAGGAVGGLDGTGYNLLTRDIVVAGTKNLVEDIIGRVKV